MDSADKAGMAVNLARSANGASALNRRDLNALWPFIQSSEPMLSAMEAGLIAADLQGRILFASPMAAHLLRKGEAELIGARLDALFPGCFVFTPDASKGSGAPYILRLKWREDQPHTAETSIPGGNGLAPRHLRLTAHPLRRDREPLGALVAVQDISKPKELEQQLRVWQEDVRDLLDGVNGFLWESNNLMNGRCVHFSTPSDKAFFRMTGYHWRELFLRTGRIIGAIEQPDSRERDEFSRRAACGELDEFYREIRISRSDGAIRWAAEKVRVVKRETDTATLTGVLIDITERKEAIERLRQSELRYRGLLETQREVVLRLDLSMRLVFVNNAFCEKFGITRAEAIGRSFLDFLRVEDMESAAESFKHLYGAGTWPAGRHHLVERRMPTPGGPRWLQWEIYAIHNEQGCICEVQGVGRDVTEDKRKTEALRQSEERYRGLVESQQDLIVRTDLESRLTYVNDVFCRLLGRPAEDLIGRYYTELALPEEEEIIRNQIRMMRQPPYRVTTERRFSTPHGERVIEWENCGIRDARGVVAELQAIGRDITERKRIERALRRSEERYRGLIESQQELIVRVDLSLRITFVNNALCRKLGRDRAELLGATYMQFVHDDDVEGYGENIKAILQPPYRAVDEKRIKTPDGPRWIQWEGYAIRDANGVIAEIQAIGRDVTDRKLAEQQVQESEARLRKIIDMAPVAIFLKSSDGRFLLANQASASLHGTTVDKLIGRRQKEFQELAPYFDVIDEEDRQVIEEGRPVVKEENLFVDSRGRRHVFHLSKFPYDMPNTGERAILGVIADITDLKKAEEALRESESRYRGLIESQSDLIIRIDAGGRLTFANDAFCAKFQSAPEETLGKVFYLLVHPDDLERTLQEMEAIRRPPHRVRIQHRAIANNKVFWLEWENCAIFDATGTLREIQGAGRDITERKRIREMMALHAARSQTLARIRALYAQAFQPMEVFEAAAQATAEEFHFAAAAVFRIEGEMARAVAWRGITDAAPEDLPLQRAAIGTGEAFRALLDAVKAGESRICAGADGENPSPFARWIRAQGGMAAGVVPIRVGGRTFGALAAVETTTEKLSSDVLNQVSEIAQEIGRMLDFVEERERRARAEQRLIQEQKEVSIATLAGGVAHDFNNILMSVTGCVDLLEDEIPPQSADARQHCRIISDSADRMAELTRHLLNYARGGPFFPDSVDVAQAINDTLAILGTQIPSNVHIQMELEEACWPVTADASQFRQALMNLVLNACEAMTPGGGTLSIRSHNESRARGESEMFGVLEEGEYVRITIQDTGCGMAPQTLTRIYEPFFSTKFEGRGMGLAAVFGIVRGHRGRIEVGSRGGEGTTFDLIWPRSTTPVGESALSRTMDLPIAHEYGVVLLVEDEETPRLVAGRMLERIGYTVLRAASGTEAIEIFQSRRDGIDLAIVDLQMPDMNGYEVFLKLRELEPDFPVIITSGMEKADVSSLTPPVSEQLYFLHKPFDIRALARAAAEALDAGS